MQREDVWKHGNGTRVAVPNPVPSSGGSVVYSTSADGDTNRWILVVQVFQPESSAGVYYCDKGSGTNSMLSIQSGV